MALRSTMNRAKLSLPKLQSSSHRVSIPRNAYSQIRTNTTVASSTPTPSPFRPTAGDWSARIAFSLILGYGVIYTTTILAGRDKQILIAEAQICYLELLRGVPLSEFERESPDFTNFEEAVTLYCKLWSAWFAGNHLGIQQNVVLSVNGHRALIMSLGPEIAGPIIQQTCTEVYNILRQEAAESGPLLNGAQRVRRALAVRAALQRSQHAFTHAIQKNGGLLTDGSAGDSILQLNVKNDPVEHELN